MPSRILSDLEVEQLASWPVEVARSDLAAFFTLSLQDLRWVRAFRSARAKPDRLGLAVQLCALPFLGFIPTDLTATPTSHLSPGHYEPINPLRDAQLRRRRPDEASPTLAEAAPNPR